MKNIYLIIAIASILLSCSDAQSNSITGPESSRIPIKIYEWHSDFSKENNPTLEMLSTEGNPRFKFYFYTKEIKLDHPTKTFVITDTDTTLSSDYYAGLHGRQDSIFLLCNYSDSSASNNSLKIITKQGNR